MRFLFSSALLAQVWAGSAQIYFSKQLDWQHDYEYLGGVVAFDSSQQLLLAGGNLRLDPVTSSFFVANMTSQGEVLSENSFQPVVGAFGNTSASLHRYPTRLTATMAIPPACSPKAHRASG